jgi:hypothetical protein
LLFIFIFIVDKNGCYAMLPLLAGLQLLLAAFQPLLAGLQPLLAAFSTFARGFAKAREAREVRLRES